MNSGQEPSALEDATWEFMRRVSLLTRDDSLRVIWAYSRHLQHGIDLPNGIETIPEFHELDMKQLWISEWELETIAREVLIHAREKGLSRRTLRRWDNISTLVNCLKRLENELYGEYGSQDNVLIEMARIAHRQFSWQQRPLNSETTIRYYKIFNTETINEIARERMGLSVEEIYLGATAYLGMLLSHPAVRFPPRSGSKLLPEEMLARFADWYSMDASSMSEVLSQETKIDDTFAYSFSSLRRWPLIASKDEADRDIVLCPLPTLLFWRCTAGLYYDLREDSRFSDALGESFQNYVGEVMARASATGRLTVLPEQEYGSKKVKRTVDWIISDERDAIFMECKSKRLRWGARAGLSDISVLVEDIEKLGGFIVQVYKTLRDYLDGKYPHFPYREGREIYPMVVTLENWRLFGPKLAGILRSAVARQLREAGLPEEWMSRFPYSVVAIDEAETIFQAIDSIGIAEFLDAKVRNAEFAGWEWGAYARQTCPNFQYRSLFRGEYDELFADVRDEAA